MKKTGGRKSRFTVPLRCFSLDLMAASSSLLVALCLKVLELIYSNFDFVALGCYLIVEG